MSVWFTSDCHFHHANIIKFCDRPYADVAEMNEKMVANWNAVVRPNDDVYIVGDLSFGRYKQIEEILKQLNGKLHLIYGNHDGVIRKHEELQSYFVWCKDIAEIKYKKQRIVMCHYAMKVWNNSHRGAWHLYGHSHGTLPDDPNSLSFDIGFDSHNCTPISFEQVEAIIEAKEYQPIDHHDKDTT